MQTTMRKVHSITWFDCQDCPWRDRTGPLANDLPAGMHLREFPDHQIVQLGTVTSVNVLTGS